MEELSYVLTLYFVSCVILTFLAASILIFSLPLWISVFFFLRNSSPLFLITRSGSFCVLHVSVNIKNNAEKYRTLLFFLCKSPEGQVISFQIKPWVAFGLPCLLIELFYIGMPVVWTDGRSVYGHVTTKFCRMGRLQYFLSYGAPPTRGASHELELLYYHVIVNHHFESVRWVTWLFTLLSPFGRGRTRKYSPLDCSMAEVYL